MRDFELFFFAKSKEEEKGNLQRVTMTHKEERAHHLVSIFDTAYQEKKVKILKGIAPVTRGKKGRK